MSGLDGPLPIPLADGRYELVEELGSGGAAVVYRAIDHALGVRRAIKVLHRGKGTMRRRMIAEAQAMARLNHPNILKVYDVGRDGERDFIVMELAESGTLADLLEDFGPLPQRQVIGYGVQILAGLAVAHAAGIVHRDVKPQNVLLDRQGTALLADFGIALVAGDIARRTRTGVAMGSLAYMPPEQRLDARSVQPTADLYAVGASLYTLLTARNPVDLFTAERGSLRWAGVSEPVAAVIRRATRQEPAERYPSAGAMAADLLGLLELDDRAALPRPDPADPAAMALPGDGEGIRKGSTLPLGALPVPNLDPSIVSLTDLGVHPTAVAAILDRDRREVVVEGGIRPGVALWIVGPSALVLVGFGLWWLAAGLEPESAPLEPADPVEEPAPAAPQPEEAPTAVVTPPPEAAPIAPRAPTPAVAPAPPSPAPVAPGPPPLGTWKGSLNGQVATLVLSGSPAALRGTFDVRLGDQVVQSPVTGSWDRASRALRLEDALDADDSGVYQATLTPDLSRMEGTFSYRHRDRVVPFALSLR